MYSQYVVTDHGSFILVLYTSVFSRSLSLQAYLSSHLFNLYNQYFGPFVVQFHFLLKMTTRYGH